MAIVERRIEEKMKRPEQVVVTTVTTVILKNIKKTIKQLVKKFQQILKTNH